MSTARYAEGVLLLVLTFAPAGAAAVSTRRSLLPTWTGAPARLVEILTGLSLVLLVAQIVGGLGAFRPWPLALGEVLAAGAVGVGLRRLAPRWEHDPPALPVAGPTGRLAGAAVVLAVSVTAAQWLESARSLFHTGITEYDSMQYHLTQSAVFVQSHSLMTLHPSAAGQGTQYYPFDTELLHAIGMLDLSSDMLSLLVNLLFLGVALLAAWCLGRAFGHPAASMVAISAVFSTPIFGPIAGGSALNDVEAIALLLTGCALVALSGGRTRVLSLAVLACGVALATKLTVLGMVAALLVVCLVAAVDRRRLLAVGLPTLVVSGGFWYLRNLVKTGSPLPNEKLGVGHVHLPTATLPFDHLVGGDVARYAPHPSILWHYFPSALRVGFGPVWWAFLALAALSIVSALVSGRGPVRWLGVVALLGVLAYTLTPTTAGGLTYDHPLTIGTNERYLWPSLGLALALAPSAWALRRVRTATVLALSALGLLSATASRSWVYGHRSAAGVLIVLAAGAVGALTVRLLRPRGTRPAVAAAVVVALALAAAGLPAVHRYARTRYAPDGTALSLLLSLGNDVSHTRIGVVGNPEQYPLFGPGWTNRVNYLGRPGPLTTVEDYTTCASWRTGVNASRDRYVVIQPFLDLPDFVRWTRNDPAAHLVATNSAGTVFRIDGPLNAAACGASGDPVSETRAYSRKP